jgi:hypothetical protein
MAKRGQPTKLTPELQVELLGLLSEGKPIEPSCRKVGIDDSTFRLWRSKARQGDPALQEFFALVARARAEGELSLWDIAKAGDVEGSSNGQARCAQWLLERTFGNRYAQRLNVKLEEGLEVLLADVERVCGAKDCGCFEAILTALAARRDGESEALGEEGGEARIH